MTVECKGLTRRQIMAAAAGVVAAPAVVRFSTPAEAAAPMMGLSRPSHYRFKLGGFEITTINDGAIPLDGPHPIFGMDQAAEDVQKLAEANFLPGSRFEISFTPVIVNTGAELVVFDCGNGAARRPNAGQLAALLAGAGYGADQVDVVVLTHFHPDHIGGLMEDGSPLFPNARYVTHETEFNFWTHADRMAGPTEGVAKLTASNVKPLAEKMTFLKGGSTVVSGITALASHGHTPGHTSFHLESEGKRLFLGGDFCNHPVVSLQRPDWHVRFDMDKEMAVSTRRKILDMLASERLVFTSYHMPFPAVGYVDRVGDGYRYVAAAYQLNL